MTEDEKALEIAERAAHWVETNRGIEGGGFRHDAKDRGGPFIGDTLAMGQAFLDLYAGTGERAWLKSATAAGDYVGAAFKDPAGGFLSTQTSEAGVGVFTTSAKQLDEQVSVARFMNLLNRYTGNSLYRGFAVHGMRYAVGASQDLQRPLPGGLLADLELGWEPTHITIVGRKDDKDAAMLFAAARACPAGYERLEWWDTSEGPLTNPDVTYPELDKPAAFACSNRTCSLPVFTGADLTAAVGRMTRAAP